VSVRQVGDPAWRETLAAAGLNDLTALLDATSPQSVARGTWTALEKPGLGGRQRWRWELETSTGPAVVYVKRYGRTAPGAQLERMLRQYVRHSRAWWEFRQSQRLAAAYIPVPDAVGVIEEQRGPLERRSVVLLGAVPGDALDRSWQRLVAAGAPLTRGLARHDLVRRLARFVSAFHQSNTCHRDLYLCHIFADLDPSGQRRPEFWLIDLARTIRPRLRRMRWLLKDLSQLDYSADAVGATRTDRLRFLEAYLGLQRGAPRVRWYARRIVRRSNRIRRRERRKGRA